MMNTLANHGFLPHDGKDLTQDKVTKGLVDGLNFAPPLTKIMFEQALIANPVPNATSFSLGDLNRHNVLEHDASLSRTDAYFGNNHIFNATIFAETKQFWTSDILNAQQLADSKLARQISSRAFNPDYRFTSKTESFSIGELLAPVVAFGDVDAVTVNRSLVEYFFENERLPDVLGWQKTNVAVGLETILRLADVFSKATNLTTAADMSGGDDAAASASPSSAESVRSRNFQARYKDLHGLA